ncbi:hypothetical protein K439DRAFT_1407267, partial [Ramaria rubella]
MSTEPTRPSRGRGGLGKYLRARGRRGTGRSAEFGKRLVLESEERNDKSGSEDDEDERHALGNKYAKRQLGTNADRYEEPQVDLHHQESEPEVDLSTFLAKQRLTDQEDRKHSVELDENDGIDRSLSNSHFACTPNMRKNKTKIINWDSSMDELKREKEAAEAVWDLKSRFRKNQPRLVSGTRSSPRRRDTRTPARAEDSRHVYTPANPDTNDTELNDDATKPHSKEDMEHFLDDLLS